MTPLERAARALWADREQHQHPRTRQTWEQGSELARKFAMDHARAVIEAIREPSEAMVDEGAGYAGRRAENSSHADDNAREAWTAMIDALLAEGAK